MRIAILTHGDRPFGHVYARAFRDEGHDAEVLSIIPETAAWGDERARVIGDGKFSPRTMDSRWQYVRLVRPVRKVIRELRPDVVIGLYLTSAGILAVLSGHRFVVVSALGTDVNKRLERRSWRAIFRWQSRRARIVHAVSDDLAAKLEAAFGLDPARIVVAPIGIDVEQLPWVSPSERPDAGVVISTRAHAPVYDQPTLVRAAQLLRERGVQCSVVFASGREVAATEEAVRSAGIDDMVEFMGGFDSGRLSSILGAADVYVSCARSDGTSQSLLEAMATGTFPVVTDIEANRAWIDHGRTGLLFTPGDADDLAECLQRALADPELRAAAAHENRARVLEHGDVRAIAGRLLQEFENRM